MKAAPASSPRLNSTAGGTALLSISLAIGVVALFLRILTLPYSFSHVLILRIYSAIGAIRELLLPLPGMTPHYQYAPLHVLTIGTTIAFLTVLVVTLIHGLTRASRDGFRALAPLGLNLVHLLLLVNLQEFVVRPDFYIYQSARATIVESITAQDLQLQNLRTVEAYSGQSPHRVYTAVLPPASQHLSTGFESTLRPGAVEVVCDQADRLKAVFFFRSSQPTGHGPAYTAFVYKSDDTPVEYKDIFGVADLSYYLGILESRRLAKNWYWIDVWED